MKFEIMDMENGEVLTASIDDACKAMTRLEALRKQRAFLIGRLGVSRRDSDRAMRLAEKDRQALLDTVERLNAELDVERAESAKWRDIAERCFASAMKNAVALADEHKGERGE